MLSIKPIGDFRQNYVSLKLYHSKGFMESYMVLEQNIYNPEKKKFKTEAVIKYLYVDYIFVNKLIDYFTAGSHNNANYAQDSGVSLAKPVYSENTSSH